MLNMVGNPEDRFSRVAAHMIVAYVSVSFSFEAQRFHTHPICKKRRKRKARKIKSSAQSVIALLFSL